MNGQLLLIVTLGSERKGKDGEKKQMALLFLSKAGNVFKSITVI